MSHTIKSEDGFVYVSYKGKKNKKPFKFHIGSLSSVADNSAPLHNFGAVMTELENELKSSDFIKRFKEDLSCVLDEWDIMTSQNCSDGASNVINDVKCVNKGKDSSDDPSNATNDIIPLNSIRACYDSVPCIINSRSLQKESSNGMLLVNNTQQDVDILCYGLGQFSSCVIARYQLGFLLILKEILRSTNVYIYDPQFSEGETTFLKERGLDVLYVNEEAKRTLKQKTVCFLPHCDLFLYNNLLWANWGRTRLSEIVIIGNSFQNYELRHSKGSFKKRAKYVYRANQFVTEKKMANVFPFADVFNDLSVHYFRPTNLGLVDLFIWNDLEEPSYNDD